MEDSGRMDCFVYEYSYVPECSSERYWYGEAPEPVAGRLYIYPEESCSSLCGEGALPEGFAEGRDFLVCDLTGGKNPNMQVRDSCRCRSVRQMRAIAEALLEYGRERAPNWVRTGDSLVAEWIEHNRYARFSDRARHVDFDNAEEGKGAAYYFWKAVRSVFQRDGR